EGRFRSGTMSHEAEALSGASSASSSCAARIRIDACGDAFRTKSQPLLHDGVAQLDIKAHRVDIQAASVRFRAADRDPTIVTIEAIDPRLLCVPRCATMARSFRTGSPSSIVREIHESCTRLVCLRAPSAQSRPK